MNIARLLTVIFACNMTILTTSATTGFDENKPVGWAMVEGQVTGSDDENPITVTTTEELAAAMKTSEKNTIYVKNTIIFNKQLSISGAHDKTIYGLPGSALSNPTHSDNKNESGILVLKNCQNIILRNLTFKGAGAYDIDGNDNLTLQGCQRVWVDHCDFQDGVDGNLDCQHGSDYICISWCRFRYLVNPWNGGSGGATYVNVYKEKRIKTSVYSQILCIFAPNKNLLKVNKRKNISNLLILYN